MFAWAKSRVCGRRSLGSDERGSIAVIAAAVLPVSIAAAALAVDMGSLYLERRAAQGAVDLAALAAAADMERANAAAAATMAANGIDGLSSLQVTKGSYQGDPRLRHTDRFRAGGSPGNAVEVVARRAGRVYFASYFTSEPMHMEVRAVAVSASQATFSVGSRLLAVRDGLVNKVLGALVGGNVALSVMDYNALAQADVKMQPFLDALATQVGVTAGTYSDVLSAHATMADVVRAMAAVAAANHDASAAAALTALLGSGSLSSVTVPLTALLNLGPLAAASIGQPNPGLDATFTALEVVSAAAVIANGGRQVAADLGVAIPGLLSLKLELAIGELPQQSGWATVGQADSMIRTAQMRLRLTAEVAGSGLLAGAKIKLPVMIDVAYAQGRLAEVACSSGAQSDATATIATRPGIAQAWIGELQSPRFNDFSTAPRVTAAKMVDVALAKVFGSSHVTMGNTRDTMLAFTQADVDSKTIKRADTSNFAESLISSLLRNLDLQVQVAGLNLGLGGTISNLVATILGTVARPLDQVVYTLLTALGVHLGEADVRVHGIRCGASVLAG